MPNTVSLVRFHQIHPSSQIVVLASTFACRVTTSTLSDSYSAICSAIGTLRGSLHGGANEKAFRLISSFDNPQQAKQQILKMLKKKVKIMGFGHRVCQHLD